MNADDHAEADELASYLQHAGYPTEDQQALGVHDEHQPERTQVQVYARLRR